MDSTAWLAVSAGGALGALARAVLFRAIAAPARSGRAARIGPEWATLAVNLIGCLFLGAWTARFAGSTASGLDVFVMTGVCGALTTFSTLAADAIRLTEQLRLRLVAVYLSSTLVLGVLAFQLGRSLAG